MAIQFSDISFLDGDFDEEVDNYKRYAERRTGFDNLDAEQIFMPGLYVLGGLPAAGKTTFALQLLCQLAARGEQCFYFSFEMAECMLWAKVLACALFLSRRKNDIENASKSALTATNLLRGRFADTDEKQEVDAYRRELSRSRLPLKIAQVNLSVKSLLRELPQKEGAVVVLDYLQMLAHDKDNPRGAIDETIFSFREYQRKTKSTLIILNSFNRESYRQAASMASFKESGGIEYSADVCWALQAYGFKKSESGKYEFDYEASREEGSKFERKIRLSCLKNRFGRQYTCDFCYYAAFDCFCSQLMAFEDYEEEKPADAPKRKYKK